MEVTGAHVRLPSLLRALSKTTESDLVTDEDKEGNIFLKDNIKTARWFGQEMISVRRERTRLSLGLPYGESSYCESWCVADNCRMCSLTYGSLVGWPEDSGSRSWYKLTQVSAIQYGVGT